MHYLLAHLLARGWPWLHKSILAFSEAEGYLTSASGSASCELLLSFPTPALSPTLPLSDRLLKVPVTWDTSKISAAALCQLVLEGGSAVKHYRRCWLSICWLSFGAGFCLVSAEGKGLRALPGQQVQSCQHVLIQPFARLLCLCAAWWPRRDDGTARATQG